MYVMRKKMGFLPVNGSLSSLMPDFLTCEPEKIESRNIHCSGA